MLKNNKKKQPPAMNYSFILKCLCGVAAAALVTTGIILMATAKVATVAAVGLAATSVFPMLALLLILGGLCLLPFLFFDVDCHDHRHHRHRHGIFVPPPPIVVHGGCNGGAYVHHHHARPAVVVVENHDVHHHHGRHHQHECAVM